MRFSLFTRYLSCWLVCAGLASVQGVAFAQVYKSYDANGRVVFSDKPGERSEEVELSKPNLSDPVKVPPPSASGSASESGSAAQPRSEPATPPDAEDDTADTNHDGRVSRREKDEQRKEQRRKTRESGEAESWYSD